MGTKSQAWAKPHIYERHNQGYSVLQIADYLSIPRPTVYYWLKKEGKRPHTTNRAELTSRQVAKIVELWESYLPVTSISKQTGIPYDQVRYQIRKYRVSA
jgi:hypothetical protein